MLAVRVDCLLWVWGHLEVRMGRGERGAGAGGPSMCRDWPYLDNPPQVTCLAQKVPLLVPQVR